ncbi:hypothetical protein CEUSTIGMA_g7086.t1 [Chlamydomonas eustigma]|uniref:Protein kinase domain-containing protein n=1 Tax=Chlamydomonas eustigma TaxID=1157962 RepID=A0A250X983_9CHLO|nr:hypothetical protein CEUSTIGMA_g7086.t1 [Chlamydomonas eustigma]|eukprot:GAX79645.1 hypothetical protein CEUSTIGMA_g7086.t1 [Chlamydomonas eustigma]
MCASLKNLHRFAPSRPVQKYQRQVHTSVQTANSTLTVSSFGFSRDFSDKFSEAGLIGSGAFGSVHVAVDQHTGERFAVKVIKKKFSGSVVEPFLARRIQHEVDIYNRLGRSLSIAHMYAAFEDDKEVRMVMELCSGGELWGRVRERGRYTEREAAWILHEVVLALALCHAKGIVVRDVKPDNFLFLDSSEDAPLKMIDFGLAEYCTPGQFLSERAGTQFYVAPEVLKQKYDFKSDVWSAGVLAYELMTGRLPFTDEDGELLVSDLKMMGGRNGPSARDINRSILSGVLDFTLPPWDALSSGAREVLSWMLTRDPLQRPSALEVLRHPWLAESVSRHATLHGRRVVDTSQSSMSSLEDEGGSGHVISTNLHEVGSSAAASAAPGTTAHLNSLYTSALEDSLVQRLQRYGSYPRLKKLALRLTAEMVVLEVPSVVRRIAGGSLLEEGANGINGTVVDPHQWMLSARSVAQFLSSCKHFDLSRPEIETLLTGFSGYDMGLISYYEWAAAMMDWDEIQALPQWIKWTQLVFDRLDRDHSGSITSVEIEAAICGENSEGCSFDDEIPAVLREVGHYEDPKGVSIGIDELRHVMAQSESDSLYLYESRRVD